MRVALTIVLISSMLFAVTVVTPAAAGDHCTAKIGVYGRTVLTPVPQPPYASSTSGICPRPVMEADEAHTLPPNTDQVMVRINGDFGPSIQTVRVELAGLGFQGDSFTLNRTQSELGGFTYSMRSWAFVPEPGLGGDLVVTAFYRDGPMSVTYHSAPVFVSMSAIPDPPSA